MRYSMMPLVFRLARVSAWRNGRSALPRMSMFMGKIQVAPDMYEPSKAVGLQNAVARQFENPLVRTGLLHLIRMFPPEDVVPEPEFRGIHHLPAAALPSVV